MELARATRLPGRGEGRDARYDAPDERDHSAELAFARVRHAEDEDRPRERNDGDAEREERSPPGAPFLLLLLERARGEDAFANGRYGSAHKRRTRTRRPRFRRQLARRRQRSQRGRRRHLAAIAISKSVSAWRRAGVPFVRRGRVEKGSARSRRCRQLARGASAQRAPRWLLSPRWEEVYLPLEVVEVLRQHRAWQREQEEERGEIDGAVAGLVFPSRNGRYRFPAVLTKPLARCCHAAGINKRLTSHCMRVTSSNLIRQAAGDAAARAMVGHAKDSTDMTFRYSDVDKTERLAAQKAAFGEFLSTNRGTLFGGGGTGPTN